MNRPWLKIISAILVLILLVLAGAIFLLVKFYAAPETEKISGTDQAVQALLKTNSDAALSDSAILTAAEQAIQKIAAKTRPALGRADAPLNIVGFCDFQCPNCHKEFTALRQFITENQDQVRFTFRTYPTIDENSLILAEAGYCAEEQGKFWSFHDRWFLAPLAAFSVDRLRAAAEASGLQWTSFYTCLTTDRYKDKVNEDVSDAVSLGVVGTPTFFVNGHILPGVVKLADWQAILNKIK